MADLNTKIPAIDASFYSLEQVPANRNKMNDITNNYGDIINNVSALTHVALELIVSTIFIESAGNPNAKSGAGAVGLMQLIPSSASDILELENRKKRLTDPEKAILRKYMGGRLDCLMKMKYLGDKVLCNGTMSATFVTAADLYNPEFNILVGAIFLGILIDEETEILTGNTRLDKVVVRYNKGYFTKIAEDSIEDVIAAAPVESQNYIYKLVGTNGTLDTLIG